MATRALNTKLKIGSTTIGGLTSIGGIELTADTLDVTTLESASGYREFINGLIDAGEVSAEGYLSEKGTSEATFAGYIGSDSKSCEIEFSNGAKWTFTGLVTGFSTNADLEDPLSFTITIKVTGKPTFAAAKP